MYKSKKQLNYNSGQITAGVSGFWTEVARNVLEYIL